MIDYIDVDIIAIYIAINKWPITHPRPYRGHASLPKRDPRNTSPTTRTTTYPTPMDTEIHPRKRGLHIIYPRKRGLHGSYIIVG